MPKHVILLTDAHEAPALELIQALSDAGINTLVEGLREKEARIPTSSARDIAEHGDSAGLLPVAIVYEVAAGSDMAEIYAVAEHSAQTWPTVPLVGCRRAANRPTLFPLRYLESTTLARLGFRAVADRPAQMPVLLREIEEGGAAEPFFPPAVMESTLGPECMDLPRGLSVIRLRGCFDLVSALHFATDQTSAAHMALDGVAPLIRASQWALYLSCGNSMESAGMELLAAIRTPVETNPVGAEADALNWPSNSEPGIASFRLDRRSQAAHEAVAKAAPIRKLENGHYTIAAPLVSNDKVLGVIEGVRQTGAGRNFSKPDLLLLGALARPIASALGNSARIADAERLSQTDDLTKLHNARYLRQFLVTEIKRARRYSSSVAAFFLDLDDFKCINDRHGHLVGSHVLMEMAAVILSSVRDTDVVARYGGDEFVVILPETDIEHAALVTERVRTNIASHSFTGGRQLRLGITASFGVAAFPEHASSPQQLIACADSAMYEAKAARKNCIRYANTALPEISEKLVPR